MFQCSLSLQKTFKSDSFSYIVNDSNYPQIHFKDNWSFNESLTTNFASVVVNIML